MKWYKPRKSEAPTSGRRRVPRWLAVTASFLGSALGVATNLYSSEFRKGIETLLRGPDLGALPVFTTAVVASGSTAVAYRWLVKRRQTIEISQGEIKIKTDALGLVESEQDVVVGRLLHYIEAKRDSDQLVVFLHGLGLDAYDFRPYMVESKFHCIALTLYGFNNHEKHDEHYPPISLRSHVQLLAYGLGQLQRLYPRKRLTLVGFSFGADTIFFLTQFAFDALQDLKVHKAILLDPNINCETTTISSKIAEVDESRPLAQLIKVLESASNLSDYRYLCEYMYKITSKNFAQIQRHARDVVDMWAATSHDRFLDYMGQLIKLTDGVHVILSFNHEAMFNAIAHGAVTRGLDPSHLECSRCDHFELIDVIVLKERLEGIL